MNTVKVWFNHWFSTAYHIINMLKEDDGIRFVVVGSNAVKDCVYRAVCDEWHTEPILKDIEAYVDFCVNFCVEREIDVFVPRRNMLAVSRRLAEFDAIGVKVLVERDFTTMSALSDKAKTYRALEDSGVGCIPPYRIAKSVSEFESAYFSLKTDNNRICMKFASDEGAVSFRVIDDRFTDSLTEEIGKKIPYENAIKALKKLKKFHKLLVMPYLPGAEVSVDCLPMPDAEHVAIPRYKTRGRSEVIKHDPVIIDMCKFVLDYLKLSCPCNIQFKYDGGAPYLLEINARMSGGIQLACASAGINIPNIAVNRLLGVHKKQTWNKKERVMSFIETPVIMR